LLGNVLTISDESRRIERLPNDALQNAFSSPRNASRTLKEHSLFFRFSWRGKGHGYTFRLMPGIDHEVVTHALKVARENGFAEVDIAAGESRFHAVLEPGAPRRLAKAKATEPPVATEPTVLPVRATQVGYYRPSSNPLSVGQKIEKGQLVAVISALGLINDVESGVSGTVIEVLVHDGDPVQFGQPLAMVEP